MYDAYCPHFSEKMTVFWRFCYGFSYLELKLL